MSLEKSTFSVSQINEYLKMLLDGDRVLSNVFVRGELSNFKKYPSGHLYFTLKDTDGLLKSVMFRSHTVRLSFLPSDGMRVIAHGRVSVYESSGQYQLYVDELIPDGVGSLALQFEQLKRKLESEGLFDPSRKKPLPTCPMRIGVITSPAGAAVQDIKNILARRFPMAQMILYPSLVQGADAPEQLISGLAFFEATDMVDLIIIGRGGGSMEDLWAFNDEMLARTLAACHIPTISAVGHETDFTICDFVADRRAPTPSAAAELAVPDRRELLRRLDNTGERIKHLIKTHLADKEYALCAIKTARVFEHPERLFEPHHMRLSDASQALEDAVRVVYAEKRRSLGVFASRLEALSPLSVLSRGYASVTKGNRSIASVQAVLQGDNLRIRFYDGTVFATADRTELDQEN